MKKRVWMAFVAAVIVIVGATLVSNFRAGCITDGSVNPLNGDVTFGYYSHETYGMVLESYDCEGNLLWEKSIYTEGGTFYIAYVGYELQVYVCRPQLLYTLDREGNILTETATDTKGFESDVLDYVRSDYWREWEKQGKTYTYTCDSLGLTYVYQRDAHVAGREFCRVYIENGDGEQITVYGEDRAS